MDAHLYKQSARQRALNRRRIVGVLGAGDDTFAAYRGLAVRLGMWIAEAGYDLLTGGGAGMMEAVSQAFFETPGRRGLVIGIVPAAVPALDALERRDAALAAPVEYVVGGAYPNRWVELAIFTHLPLSGRDGTAALSRNHINVLTSDALVALPGGEGTFSEVWLALRYGVPVIAYHPEGVVIPVPAGAARTAQLQEVQAFVRRHVAATVSRPSKDVRGIAE